MGRGWDRVAKHENTPRRYINSCTRTSTDAPYCTGMYMPFIHQTCLNIISYHIISYHIYIILRTNRRIDKKNSFEYVLGTAFAADDAHSMSSSILER